ncbi:uncharacterized protein C2845_PM05G32500 [Panicum miliaceum]|uniref:Uncharacterized protein n=1 Tax=Panicum miliaceum TaxID=4540 RepID=A0A3L6SXG0_PANMI|nr:uncharacterized protein C2845_PM05G32500 [Panicum miliaceum]
MECEPEELQFLGAAGVYSASAQVLRGPHRLLFARIVTAFVLPLSALFLLGLAISHALFRHIEADGGSRLADFSSLKAQTKSV